MTASALPPLRPAARTIEPVRLLATAVTYLFLVILAAATVYPFLLMVSVAFRPGLASISYPMSLIPENPGLGNFELLFGTTKLLRWVFNSTFVTITVVLLDVATCTLAGYAFARGNFPGREAIFWVLMGTLMVPESVRLVPIFIILSRLGWVNTYYALIVPRATSIFGTFLLRQYYNTIPRDYDDSARIDGASHFTIYSRILFPLARPAVATLATLAFLSSWNDFLYPLIVTSRSEMQVLTVGIATMVRQEGAAGFEMASATIAFLPTFCVFLAMQRYVTSGMVMSGLKG